MSKWELFRYEESAVLGIKTMAYRASLSDGVCFSV